MNTNENRSCLYKGEGLSRKGGQGTFWEDGHVLYLFKDLRYQTRCIYQNFSSDTLEIFTFHCM